MYRAPSWSWASINGPVKFAQQFSIDCINPDGSFSGPVIIGNLEPEVEIISAQCTLTSLNQTGSVCDGHVTLSGYIAQGRYRFSDGDLFSPHICEKGDLAEAFSADFSPSCDASGILDNGDTIYCFKLGLLCWPPEPPSKFRAIVLKDSKSHPGEFERIGFIVSSDHDSEEWYQGIEKKQITIR